MDESWCVVAAKDLVAPGEIHLVTTENVEARARLIAAAPDLLAACEGYMKTCAGHEFGPTTLAIQAAIAKAKGPPCPT